MQRIALILAGGKGERLFPLTLDRPKFLLEISDKKSLLELTIKRIPLERKNIYVVTEEKFAAKLKGVLRKLKIPISNLILESSSKNTLPALLLSLFKIKERFSQEVLVGVLPSDHLIRKEEIFKRQLISAYNFSEEFDKIILFGLKPKKFDKNFGYIQITTDSKTTSLKSVERFIEKPTKKIDLNYLLLNLGIFVAKAEVFLSEIEKYQGNFFRTFLKYYQNKKINEFYDKIMPLQIDKCILEKSKKLLVMPAKFIWSDVGNFLYLDKFLKKDFKKNYFKGKIFSLNTFQTTLISDSREEFLLLGLKGIFIVKYKDKILISNKKFLPKIRELLKIYHEGKNTIGKDKKDSYS